MSKLTKQPSFSDIHDFVELIENEWVEMVERLVELGELASNEDGDLYWVASRQILGQPDIDVDNNGNALP